MKDFYVNFLRNFEVNDKKDTIQLNFADGTVEKHKLNNPERYGMTKMELEKELRANSEYDALKRKGRFYRYLAKEIEFINTAAPYAIHLTMQYRYGTLMLFSGLCGFILSELEDWKKYIMNEALINDLHVANDFYKARKLERSKNNEEV